MGLLVATSLSPAALAANSTAWVSSTGVDNAQCTRAAPCRYLATAVTAVASGGEIRCLDVGPYQPLFITKPVTIDCGGGLIQNSDNFYGVHVNIDSGAVVLRNLAIQGAGTGTTGVYVQHAPALSLENVSIQGNINHGIHVAAVAHSYVTLVHVTIRGNAQHGVLVAPSPGITGDVTIVDSTLAANGLTGIRVNDYGSASLSDTVLSGNGTHGAAAVGGASGSPPRIALDRVTSAGNVNGGLLASGPSAVIYMSNVFTTNNAYGIYPAQGGGVYISFGNNRSAGNKTADGAPTVVIAQI